MVVEIHIQSLSTSHSRLVPVYLNDERIYRHVTILYRHVHGNTVEHVAFLVLKHQHLRNLGKGFSIHQHQTVALDVYGRAQRRNLDIQIRVEHRFGSRIKVDYPLKRTKHRDDRVQRWSKFYQLGNIDFMQLEIESGIPALLFPGTINQRSIHLRIHSPHAQILQMNSLIANVDSSLYIFEYHAVVLHPLQVGLQFEIEIFRNDKQRQRRRGCIGFCLKCIFRKIQ